MASAPSRDLLREGPATAAGALRNLRPRCQESWPKISSTCTQSTPSKNCADAGVIGSCSRVERDWVRNCFVRHVTSASLGRVMSRRCSGVAPARNKFANSAAVQAAFCFLAGEATPGRAEPVATVANGLFRRNLLCSCCRRCARRLANGEPPPGRSIGMSRKPAASASAFRVWRGSIAMASSSSRKPSASRLRASPSMNAISSAADTVPDRSASMASKTKRNCESSSKSRSPCRLNLRNPSLSTSPAGSMPQSFMISASGLPPPSTTVRSRARIRSAGLATKEISSSIAIDSDPSASKLRNSVAKCDFLSIILRVRRHIA
mmetsp:Transcript_9149/g.26282  ORF Transcript_9149/g.26282 Transcript_9149/m.26282 type:complete len:320 (-) Transcript_9149:59-1018(-)